MASDPMRPFEPAVTGRTEGPIGLIIAALVVSGAAVFLIHSSWLAIGLWTLGAVAAVLYVTRSAPVKSEWTLARSRQAGRSKAIGLALIACVALFYVATMTRLKGNALNKPSPRFEQPVKVIDPADVPKAKQD